MRLPMDAIHIVSVSDDNYARHLAVMLASLLENTSDPRLIHIHILQDDYQEETVRKITKMINRYGSSLSFYHIESSAYSHLATRNISHAAYYKLSIPNILKDLEKAIFLDCDMVVLDDVAKLWSIDLNNYFLAAVREGQFKRHKQLLMPDDADYFNSGMMYINLDLWRKHNITKKALNFLTENSERLTFHDQEGFNAVLHMHSWIRLHPKWNQLSSMYRWSYEEMRFGAEEYEEARKNPSIVHFTGDSKPWHYLHAGDMADRPFKDKYYQYLALTEWNNSISPEKELFSKDIVIFGTGILSQQITQQLAAKGHTISFYVDNNPEKVGTMFLGREVLSPVKLGNLDKENVIIVVASKAFKEISEQLSNMDFRAGIHFVGGTGIRKYQ